MSAKECLWTVSLGVFCFFSFLAFAAPAAADSRWIQGRQGDWRFQAAADWQDFPADSGFDRAVERFDPYCSVMVVRLGEAPRASLNAELLSAMESLLTENFVSSATVAMKIENFLDGPAAWVEMKGKTPANGDTVMRQRYYVVHDKGTLYGFIITAQDASWETAKKHWQGVLESFEFL